MNEISLLRICRNAATLTAISALSCFLLLPVGVGAGILLGGLLSVLNLLWLRDSIDALIPQERRVRFLRSLVQFQGRLLLTGVALAAVVWSGRPTILGFIGGHLLLLVMILAEVLRADVLGVGSGAPPQEIR